MSMLKQYIISHIAENKASIKLGASSIASISVGFIEQFETWLRMGGLVLGIIIGIMTVYRLYLDITAKKKAAKDK